MPVRYGKIFTAGRYEEGDVKRDFPLSGNREVDEPVAVGAVIVLP